MNQNMKTDSPPTRSSNRSGLAQLVSLAMMALIGILGMQQASAANILWVSDVGVPGTFSGAGSNYTDSAIVTLLQNAGYNVTRYNSSNAPAAPPALSASDLVTINANDLIILGRASASGSFLGARAASWNTSVTKPLICMSPYFIRSFGPRLGWFNGDVGPDDVPVPWTPGTVNDPTIDYIFGDVAMNGTSTAQLMSEPMDRNTSHILAAPVPGAVVIATATFPREDTAAIATGNAIVGFPAGTAVHTNLEVLPAYRMYFAAGTRESLVAANTIQYYTGRENLTPIGENVFLRAVQVALNNGVAPTTNTGPAGITNQPASVTVLRGQPATFSVTVTGAAPRTVQWLRNGSPISGAISTFPKASYSIAAADTADNGAQFRVVVSNALNVVTSSVATLTVSPDSVAPVPVSAASFDGSVITVCFNEPINVSSGGMTDPSNYPINGGGALFVTSVTPGADGRSVNLILSAPIGKTATVDFFYIEDRFGNITFTGPTLVATNFGLTGVDIGAVTPPGSNFACDTNSFQVTAGGLDIGSTADILRFVYKTVTNDFDARVRVTSFVGTNDHFETTAKAMLLVRADNTAGSAGVNVFLTPLPPGDNSVSSSYRAAAGAATNAIGASVLPNGLPNGWLRIQRVGDQFTSYRSVNGVDWTSFGSVTAAIGTALNVGVGVVSHRSTATPNGKVATATFSDLRISSGAVPVASVLTGSRYTGAGRFSASFTTQTGISYAVQYKDNLNVTLWNTLTNIAGDGTLKSFADPGPVSATGNRFYRISAQ
jgi:hypothetical protein